MPGSNTGFQTGVHGSRPAASAGCIHYSCTTHSLIYQSDGASWTTYATLTGTGYTAGGTDVAVADGGTGSSTAAGAATNLGLGTGDSPQFTAVNIGHATDTTLARSSSGVLTVEGNRIFAVGGTDVPIADGGTGASTATAAYDALSPNTTRGDIEVRGASNNVRLAVGAAATYLKSDGTDPSWAALPKRSVNFIIDGGGSTITTGVKGDVEVPFAWSDISSVRLFADQSGSIVVDIWKDTYANFPPVTGDKITASAPPTISTATNSQDTTLTGWTKTGSAGDVLRFNVTSVTTIQRVTLSLVLVAS